MVPNARTLLSAISVDCQYFPVIDLCSAFFSIPVKKDTQYLFAFTWEDRQFTWMAMPQGYTERPTHFSQTLKADLHDVDFPRDSTLIQYVGDLLLCTKTLLDPQKHTIYLLQQLAIKGHKVSKDKLQFGLPQVKCLGHLISKGGLLLI